MRSAMLNETSMMELSEAIASLKTPEEVRQFLTELCTPSECTDFALRWCLMKQLLQGRPQRTISQDLGLSLCKITRGSKFMKDKTSIFRRLILACLQLQD